MDAAQFRNESVRFGNPNYVLKIKTERGIYTIDIKPSYNKTHPALAEAINIGDKIRFRADEKSFFHDANFLEDRIDSLSSQDIIRLEK